MLVVMLKSIITFCVVFFVIRLMGKRQIGEMQPFELVITLIIAEVACIPMNDPYIPLYYGLVPIVTLATLAIVLSFISRKSVKARKLLSGSSVIVIDKNGIVYKNLQKLNMNMDDLIEAVRTAGYVDFTEIAYAIFETNGKLCVVEKTNDCNGQSQNSSGCNENKESLSGEGSSDEDKNTNNEQPTLPLELVVDGQFVEENLRTSGAKRDDVVKLFDNHNLNIKDVLYCDVRQDGRVYVSPKNSKAFCDTVDLNGGEW